MSDKVVVNGKSIDAVASQGKDVDRLAIKLNKRVAGAQATRSDKKARAYAKALAEQTKELKYGYAPIRDAISADRKVRAETKPARELTPALKKAQKVRAEKAHLRKLDGLVKALKELSKADRKAVLAQIKS